MPAFNGASNVLATQVAQGDTIPLFSAETVVAAENSTVIAVLSSSPSGRRVITFTINWAAVPTAVIEIFGSNNYPSSAGPDPAGFLLYTSTNKQNDNFTDSTGFVFYWAQCVSITGSTLCTVIANVA